MFWSLSRRLLGTERTVTTFFQYFYAIFGRGIIYDYIPTDKDEVLFGVTFFEKKITGSDALKDPSLRLSLSDFVPRP